VPIEPNLRNRAWLLGLLVLSDQAGLQNLAKTQVHSLIFLANSLSFIYDDSGIDLRVVKHEHGPFYPDAQWDLDRMVGQGLVNINSVRYWDEDGRWWLTADYRPTLAGKELFSKCRQLPVLAHSYRFLVELTTAFASLHRESMQTATLHDAIYSTPGKANWAPLVFEELEDNYSARTANAFNDMVGDGITLSPKERLNLYFAYLEQMVAKDVPEKAE